MQRGAGSGARDLSCSGHNAEGDSPKVARRDSWATPTPRLQSSGSLPEPVIPTATLRGAFPLSCPVLRERQAGSQLSPSVDKLRIQMRKLRPTEVRLLSQVTQLVLIGAAFWAWTQLTGRRLWNGAGWASGEEEKRPVLGAGDWRFGTNLYLCTMATYLSLPAPDLLKEQSSLPYTPIKKQKRKQKILCDLEGPQKFLF